MVDSRTFIKFDAIISVAFVIYYFTARGIFDAQYSTGYKAVSTFFLFMNLVGMILHGILIYADFTQNKMMVISIRGGCMAFLVGVGLTVFRLGIFSVQFIALFCISFGFHLSLLITSFKMP